MPDINMQVFEEAQRNQLVTEIDIQTQVALDDYQVHLSDIANPTQSQDNIVIDRHGEFLPHWNESLDFNTWVKMSMELTGKRILMLRGNSNVSNASSGSNTFIQWHGVATSNYLDNLDVNPTNIIYETKVKQNTTSSRIMYGLKNTVARTDDHEAIMVYPSTPDIKGVYLKNDGSASSITDTYTQDTNYHRYKLTNDGTTVRGYDDGNEISTGVTTNLPNENCGLFIEFLVSTGVQDWSFVRKYIVTEPVWTIDGVEQNIAVALKSLGRAG